MPLNHEAIERKLGAMEAKDLEDIVARQIRLPKLASPYTLTQLQAWLDARMQYLRDARNYTEAQAISARQTLHNQLTNPSKSISTAIQNGQPYELSESIADSDYIRLIGIILLTFALTP